MIEITFLQKNKKNNKKKKKNMMMIEVHLLVIFNAFLYQLNFIARGMR